MTSQDNETSRGFGRGENTVNAVWRMLVRVALIALACFAIYHLRTIIITLLVGAILAYVFEPMVDWLTRTPAFVHLHSLPLRLRNGAKVFARLSRHNLRLAATIYVFCAALVITSVGLNLIIKPFTIEIYPLSSTSRTTLPNTTKKSRWQPVSGSKTNSMTTTSSRRFRTRLRLTP